MTRDIFNPAFGTVDVIVAATLLRIGKPASLSIWSGEGAGDVTPDVLAERNARRFIEHFGDRKIAAIKAVREVTGLSLRDAKDAVSQVYETYADAEYFAEKARDALEVKAYAQAAEWAAKAAEVDTRWD